MIRKATVFYGLQGSGKTYQAKEKVKGKEKVEVAQYGASTRNGLRNKARHCKHLIIEEVPLKELCLLLPLAEELSAEIIITVSGEIPDYILNDLLYTFFFDFKKCDYNGKK